MRTDLSEGPTSDDPASEVRAALRAWRDGLVNLDGGNRLINFKRSESGTLDIAGPPPEEIVRVLRTGGEHILLPFGERDGGRIRTELPAAQLGALLRRLHKRDRQELLDRGVAPLHLALGMLRWHDEEEHGYLSPLVLLPVELTVRAPGDVPRLRLRDDDPVVNPALVLRLRHLGVELPAVDDLATFRSELGAAVAGRGWHADETVVLTCLSFHKEAMYRDLLDNEDRVLAHPIVRALAGRRGRDASFVFDPIGAEDIDRLAPPEDVPLLLDADASQRACVAAAVEGRSFVLDGPPGTGKSQTIANMIGCLLHAGKRVLFVSEKAAALEVVRNRLAAAGLGGHLLELHSHNATRKEVARRLAAAVDDVAEPPSGDPRSLSPARRRELSAYAVAMNEVRRPLGRSLHEVLGRCAVEPGLPVPDIAPAALSPEALDRMRAAADRFTGSRRAAEDGFAWRGVLDREPLDGRIRRARAALRDLATAAGRHAALAAAYALESPDDAPALAGLLDLAARRPAGVRAEWLTAPSLTAAERAAARIARERAALDAAGTAVRSAAGVDWTDLPDLDVPPLDAVASLGTVPPLGAVSPVGAVSPLGAVPPTADAAAQEARRCAAEAATLDRRQAELGRLADRLGLPGVVTFADMSRVAAIVALAGRRNRPEPFWFGPGVLANVSAGAAALSQATDAVRAAEAQARPWFGEQVLAQPVDEIADRLTNLHRGLRKLLPSYRRDWEAAAALARPPVAPADAVARLALAVAWKRSIRELAAVEQRWGPVLGRYWQRAATDHAALREAIDVAAEVLRLTPATALPRVADFVCRPATAPNMPGSSSPPSAGLSATAPGSSLPPSAGSLMPPALSPSGSGFPVVAEQGASPEGSAFWDGATTVRDAVARLRDQVAPLAAAADVLRAYRRAVGRDVDLAEASHLAGLRREAAEAESALAEALAAARDALGPEPDETALSWAKEARRGRPLTTAQVEALWSARPGGDLAATAAAWFAARDAVRSAFAAERHPEFAGYDSARDLLAALHADPAGQDDWFAHLDARRVLAEFDLGATAEHCATEHADPDLITPTLERALLRGWADAVIRADRRLHPTGGAERDRLVDAFRAEDAELAGTAAARIAAALRARRAGLPADQADLLRREGMKETRHLPVRELLGRTRDAVLDLTPCFLMSPLAVSQFLPADLGFDVVIFDEASQVTPADAVNCVYRSAALIAAGDDRQLPPTSFFDSSLADGPAAGTDVNDFPSVLELAKACGAFRSLPLTWHYRSRHESLIAFANQAFYAGRLITFPSARADGPDVGVELFPAAGVYRRGTSRDNPVEADLVVERVLHSFVTRPDLSLGVVTFSVAQAEAIEAALDRAAGRHPGLERFLDGDRLNGFFVKSLESVQGDERDVMLFSIGYGFDADGRISGNFGALSRPNGWRRLNVAITRARQRVEIVSSIRARDIPEPANESVRHLAAYLDYAERCGRDPGCPVPAATPGALEQSVLDVVREWGFEADAAVGTSAYRVDIAVRHPAGGHALGIECDGAMYRSAPAARDRDRLRAQVLRGLGWNLHRVWGTAWHRDRAGEEARLRAALDRAVSQSLPAAGPQPYRRADVIRLQPVS